MKLWLIDHSLEVLIIVGIDVIVGIVVVDFELFEFLLRSRYVELPIIMKNVMFEIIYNLIQKYNLVKLSNLFTKYNN